MLTRRRFIAISAALAPSIAFAQSPKLHVEAGVALGAQITLRLQHPEAPQLAVLAMSEIRRLEEIFSLYLPNSSLVRLNRDGRLLEPSFELLECLAVAGSIHAASAGHFDPTIQPLWQAEALARRTDRHLSDQERAVALALVDWTSVRIEPDAITMRPGMALTLNGIAQGYIADRVAALLASHGLTRALIDTGEMVALPEGDWPVQLPQGETVELQNRAIATSSPLGMTFGDDGKTSHILDPKTGRPTQSRWRAVSISAPMAAVADAVSTAACLTRDADELALLCAQLNGLKIEAAIAA